MYATLGCNTKEEAESLIDTADFAVFDSEFVCFGENNAFVKSKALDDRMGCAAMIEIMQNGTRFVIPLSMTFCLLSLYARKQVFRVPELLHISTPPIIQ